MTILFLVTTYIWTNDCWKSCNSTKWHHVGRWFLLMLLAVVKIDVVITKCLQSSTDKFENVKTFVIPSYLLLSTVELYIHDNIF